MQPNYNYNHPAQQKSTNMPPPAPVYNNPSQQINGNPYNLYGQQPPQPPQGAMQPPRYPNLNPSQAYPPMPPGPNQVPSGAPNYPPLNPISSPMQPAMATGPQPFLPSMQPHLNPNIPTMQQPPMSPSMPSMPSMPSVPGVAPSMNPNMPPPVMPRPAAPSMPNQQMAASTRPAIHPANIPNPLMIMQEELNRFRDGPFYTSRVLARSLPPRSMADHADADGVQIIDDGTSSCRFARPTCWTLPVSVEVSDQTRIPLAVSFQPFCQLPSHEPPVPVLDFGARGPIRCNRCRGYISPYVGFVRGGRSWQCNLCGGVNEVPEEYFAPLDPTGRRVDVAMRPELRCGTVDIIAGPEYNLRPQTVACRLFFLIDASRAAVQSGAFRASIEAVRTVVHSSDAQALYSHFALATFDRTVHFYNLQDGRKDAEAVVMTDLADPFLPLGPKALFFASNSAQATVDGLLNNLLALFQDTRVVESCLGSAVAVAVEALKTTGGKVFVFASSLPSISLGACKLRSEVSAPENKPNPMLLSQSDYYKKLAEGAASNGISISLSLSPVSHIDLATLIDMSSATGGSFSMYSKFSPDMADQVKEDCLAKLCCPFVYDCMGKVRCGEGLQVGEYFGPFAPSSKSDIQFGQLAADQSFAVTLQYDGKLIENEPTGIQCAILHTTPSGQRRIRVINLALPCTRNPLDVFRTCDFEAITSCLSKQAVFKIREYSLAQVSSQIVSRVSYCLAAYRKLAANNVSAAQLILPEELRLLPLFLLSILKGNGLAPNTTTSDARMAGFRLMQDLPNDLMFGHFYPRLINLLTFADNPMLLRLTRDSLDRRGIFLLENGVKMCILVGDMVPAPLLSQIFGVPQIGNINPHSIELPRLGNPISKSVVEIIDRIRMRRLNFLQLSIIRQGIDQAAEAEFLQSFLIEDGSPAGPSYADFLCRMHSQVQHDLQALSSSSAASLLADKSANLFNFFN